MEQQQQPIPRQRGRKAAKPPHEIEDSRQAEVPQQEPSPLPEESVNWVGKEDGKPQPKPGSYWKPLPDGGYMLIKNNFRRPVGTY